MITRSQQDKIPILHIMTHFWGDFYLLTQQWIFDFIGL